LFLCRVFITVFDGWCITATSSEPSIWPVRFHRLPQQALHRGVHTTVEKHLYK
jgi:hypothetical protein